MGSRVSDTPPRYLPHNIETGRCEPGSSLSSSGSMGLRIGKKNRTCGFVGSQICGEMILEVLGVRVDGEHRGQRRITWLDG